MVRPRYGDTFETEDDIARPEARLERGAIRLGFADPNGARARANSEAKPSGKIDRLRCDAEMSPPNAPMDNELAQHELGRVARDGEAKPLGPSDNGRVDPDNLSSAGHERSTRVAGVQGGVRLNHVLDQAPFLTAERPAQSRDDPGSDSRIEAERVSDGHDQLPALENAGVAQRRNGHAARHLGTQQSEVGVDVLAKHDRACCVTVGQCQSQLSCARDHVGVRKQKPVMGNDESRATTASCAASIFNTHHGWAYGFGDTDDSPGIGVYCVVSEWIINRMIGVRKRIEHD